MRYLLGSIIAFLTDLGIKEKVERTFGPEEKKVILHDRVQIEKYHNKGAVCNVLQKRPEIVKAIHTMTLVLAGIYTAALVKKNGNGAAKLGTGLLLAGGLNNLYDRYRRGYVVDYLRFLTPQKWLRRLVFNLSDFFIFFGTILLGITSRKK